MCFFFTGSTTAFYIYKTPGDSVTVGNYTLSSQQFYKLSGKHLNFIQRAKIQLFNKHFKQEQGDKALREGPLFPRRRHRQKFNLGWFLLGLAGVLLGIVVFLTAQSLVFAVFVALVPLGIAYITARDDGEKASVKWGTGSGFLLIFIFLGILFAGFEGK